MGGGVSHLGELGKMGGNIFVEWSERGQQRRFKSI